MDKVEFEKNKKELIKLIKNNMNEDCNSYEELLDILKLYNYHNRKTIKGLLTRTILDRLNHDCFLAEKIFNFDDKIELSMSEKSRG